MSTHLLDVDPLRLVDLGDGVALVIPAQGATLTLLDGGLPGVPRVLADTGQLRDAAPVAGGALLLLVQPDGARELLQLDPRSLRVAPVPASAPWPAVERVLGAGGPAALLLDEASGAVLRLEPSTGALAPLPGLRREPQAPVVLLP